MQVDYVSWQKISFKFAKPSQFYQELRLDDEQDLNLILLVASRVAYQYFNLNRIGKGMGSQKDWKRIANGYPGSCGQTNTFGWEIFFVESPDTGKCLISYKIDIFPNYVHISPKL